MIIQVITIFLLGKINQGYFSVGGGVSMRKIYAGEGGYEHML